MQWLRRAAALLIGGEHEPEAAPSVESEEASPDEAGRERDPSTVAQRAAAAVPAAPRREAASGAVALGRAADAGLAARARL
jgi:hypothetical protein